jgi:predicted DNA-binding transcriptional regulator AlpA
MSISENFAKSFEGHRILTTKEAAHFCGYSIDRWKRLYLDGKAPAPIRLSARKNGWKISSLATWLDSKASA